MTRERLAARALGAYPPVVAAAQGDEMIATLLDASAGSRARFARELAGLVRAGLNARAAENARAGARRLIADGLCLAGAWIMTLNLSVLVAQRARGMRDPLLVWPSIALLAAALAIALVGRDRLAGTAALVWLALRMPALLHDHPGLGGVVGELIPLACFTVMVVTPRRRALDLRGLVWLVVPAGLLATFGSPDGGGLLLVVVALGAILVVLVAVALLPTDPRLAIAGAVPTTGLGMGVAGAPSASIVAAVLLMATAPAVVALTIVRTRRLQAGQRRI